MLHLMIKSLFFATTLLLAQLPGHQACSALSSTTWRSRANTNAYVLWVYEQENLTFDYDVTLNFLIPPDAPLTQTLSCDASKNAVGGTPDGVFFHATTRDAAVGCTCAYPKVAVVGDVIPMQGVPDSMAGYVQFEGKTWRIARADNGEDSDYGGGVDLTVYNGCYICVGSIPPDADIHGDPHVRLFNGKHLEFQGIAGNAFNIFTSTDFQVNVLLDSLGLREATFIAAIAFQFKHAARVFVAADKAINGTHVLVSVNDKEINSVAKGVVYDHDELTVSREFSPNGDSVVTIKTPGLQLKVQQNKGAKHLDLTFSLPRPMDGPVHGIIGHSLRGDIPAFEETDFMVADLWSSDFKYDVYGKHGVVTV